MAKVLVTGGAGFIGSHVVDLLVADGHQVVVLDNLSSGRRENLNPKAELRLADIRKPETRALVAEIAPDILVHLAAQISVRVSMEDPVLDTETNVVGIVNLLHAFAGKKLPAWIFISTGGAIYGEQESFPADESHPNKPSSVYGQAKRVSEIYLDFWAREYGLRYCSLRLSNVYGPRQNPHGEAGVVAIFLKNLLAGKQVVINGSGTQTRDFVYVGDVARAVKLAVDKKAQGIYNVGTSVETSINTLFSTLTAALNSEVKATNVPAKSGEQMRSCITAAKAKNELGWEPQFDLKRGLESTAKWFKENTPQ